LVLDKHMLQEIAKKSGDPEPTANRGGFPPRAVPCFAAASVSRDGLRALDLEVSPEAKSRRASLEPGDQTLGASTPPVRIPPGPRAADPARLVCQPEAGAAALERTGAAAPLKAKKAEETRPQAWSQR
jgi:hypothetical protein